MKQLHTTILEELSNCESVLDLCAGTGDLLRNYKGIKVAIELNTKYNSILENHGYSCIYNEDVSKYIKFAELDAITWIDGIEHLEEKDALQTLERVESAAKKKVIVFTPNEFQDNKHSAKNLNEPLQEHKSVFPKEFWLSRGYRIAYQEYNEADKIDNILYVKEV